MSDVLNEAARTRRRQYRITARLLKEYTARLYRIAYHLGEYADGRVPVNQEGYPPWSVLAAASRYGAVKDELSLISHHASQMIVQYQFDEAEERELTIRMLEAEESLRITGEIVNGLTVEGPGKKTPNKKPGHLPPAPRLPSYKRP